MKIQIDQGALDALGNQIAQQAEQALNRGIQSAHGQPLDQAVRTVAHAMQSAGVEPNLDGIRSKLVELGWPQ